jgi:hypothetical protein
MIQIQRIEGELFENKEQAEQHGIELCKYAASLGGHPFVTSVVQSNRVSLSLRITQNGCFLHSSPLYMVWGWVAAA